MNRNDGPWLREDRYEKVNGVLRYSRGDQRNGFSVTGMGYWADWNSTDQVAQRAVASGLDFPLRVSWTAPTAARPAARPCPRTSSARPVPHRCGRRPSCSATG